MSKLITSDPSVMAGKPVVADTRVTVESLLERLAAGESVEQVVSAHPQLTEEEVRAALEYAAGALRGDVGRPVADSTA